MNYAKFLYWDPEFDFKLLRSEWFFLTIDLAEGAGQDSTVFNIYMVIDRDHYKHVGRWSSNEVDLEHSGLEFWLLAGQLFNGENCIWSMEWNTYGALFYKILLNLNDIEYDESSSYRFNIVPEGLETFNFVQYKKGNMDENILGINATQKTIPGIRLNTSNKPTGCTLLKILFEKDQLTTTDLMLVGELENFEDKNGNGSYKASYGHDDIIMTCIQIPLMKQTPRWANFIEDYELAKLPQSINSKWGYGESIPNIFNQDALFPNMYDNLPTNFNLQQML